MAHTPGPWFQFDGVSCVGGPHPENGTAGIAMCGMRLRSDEEVAGNIRLICAAPDLLAVLEKLLHETDDGTQLCAREFADAAHAVIRKARGQ